ncbi:MAG: AI-2E family transporter, partial [Vicinamibacterales bacterium]
MGALSASSRSGLSIAIPLWVVAVLGTLLFLRMASDLLIPIVLAIILSYALEPVVAWLEIRHVHRLAGTGLVLLTCLGLLGWGAFSLRDNVRDTARSLPQAAERLRDMVWSQTSSGTAASVREAAEVLQGDADSGGAPQPDPASTPAPSAEESAQFL